MSFADLYMSKSPLVESSGGAEPVATVLGIPFDATHSYKPGCRFGPDAIRDSFNNIEVFHPELGADLEDVAIEDLGNMRHTVSSQEMLSMLKKTVSELAKRRLLLLLGGEHSITYGSYMSYPKGTGYVVFDAHYDLRDEYADSRLSHASYLRRIIEERGADSILHVGARAFVKEELEFQTEHKIRTITDADIMAGRGPQMLKEHASAFDSLYASFDLDIVDPGSAPGVGNPEAAGVSSRELFAMIRALSDARIVCADIVELNPYHDNGATASLAAKIMSTVIAMNLP